ncbi:hypothetical protein D9M69_711160 [compost metagenome]
MGKRIDRWSLINRVSQEQSTDVTDSILQQVLLQVARKAVKETTNVQGRAAGLGSGLAREGFLTGTGADGLGEVKIF